MDPHNLERVDWVVLIPTTLIIAIASVLVALESHPAIGAGFAVIFILVAWQAVLGPEKGPF